ncbi:MAG: prepilin-type N-terminal cleavage/methylation domain-containing protein [Thermodesulfovibrio sp.]|nr:prepilin-type N-terminal cleavage/methylation domain-containing protein [Thermodesulfovibrio sp.]MDW7999067.1 prepilin-type N-terminal cleavage/methylation domain-containing protein [Thermodesulfovibrio sp.]
MEKIKNHKGFTLIELAIVLVIIGIIIGVVIKGRDLINSARTKQFISKVRAWELAQWNHLDRKGRFAGANLGGLIGSGNVKDDLLNANFINPPYEGSSNNAENKITVGSYVFYVFFGNDSMRNFMSICYSKPDCSEAFNDEAIIFAEALDISIDGVLDGERGRVIGSNGVLSSIPEESSWDNSFQPNPTAWTSSPKKIVYYFDAKR